MLRNSSASLTVLYLRQKSYHLRPLLLRELWPHQTLLGAQSPIQHPDVTVIEMDLRYLRVSLPQLLRHPKTARPTPWEVSAPASAIVRKLLVHPRHQGNTVLIRRREEKTTTEMVAESGPWPVRVSITCLRHCLTVCQERDKDSSLDIPLGQGGEQSMQPPKRPRINRNRYPTSQNTQHAIARKLLPIDNEKSRARKD